MKHIYAAFALQYPIKLYEQTKDVLDSYINHTKNPGRFDKQLARLHEVGGTMFLDSGAFSAWTKGDHIDLDAYAEFCLRFASRLEAIAGLDVIPGRWGAIPSAHEVEESAKQGWINYEKLLDKGLPWNRLIHVFHQGEKLEWLNRLVEAAPYIGISPANDKTTSQKISWLDRIMPCLVNEDGYPKVKFHGFGVTSLDIMQRYPWYSVDSTTWLRPGSYGIIYVPRSRDGAFIYTEFPLLVAVSSSSPGAKEEGKHITTLTAREQEIVLRFIDEEGFDLAKLSEDYKERHRLNIEVIKRMLAATIPSWPWSYKPKQPAFV